MSASRDIPLSRLRLDPTNPRLDDGKQTQREALAAMMEGQGEKLVALARDIVGVGLNPLERFLVMTTPDDPAEHIVLEGNRRVTVLKLLLNPDLGTGVLGANIVKTFRQLASNSRYAGDPHLPCFVLNSRDEAVHWLRLRHGGELNGAGTVSWGATERERFDTRNGKRSPELQIINFLVARGSMTAEDANAISLTNLRRLLSDQHVRQALGVEIDRRAGRVTTRYPIDEVAKSLTRVAKDLTTASFKVSRIYTKQHRKEYVQEFRRSERPDPKTVLPAAIELPLSGGSTASRVPASGGGRQGSGGRVSRPRSTVAPTSLALVIDQPRIKEIYRELQGLKVERFANAGIVLLRVFLELTVDRYVAKHKVAVQSDAKLSIRLQAVHHDVFERGTMTKSELVPIRRTIGGSDSVAASVSTFNQYVHNRNVTPSPTDVRTAWNNLQLFFERIWA